MPSTAGVDPEAAHDFGNGLNSPASFSIERGADSFVENAESFASDLQSSKGVVRSRGLLQTSVLAGRNLQGR